MEISHDPDVLPGDVDIGGRVLEVLHRHYPGWAWMVDVPPRQDVIIVRNLDADPRGNYGIMLRKSRMLGGDMPVKIMMAGGEFLERWGIIRAAYDRAFEENLVGGAIQIFKKPES